MREFDIPPGVAERGSCASSRYSRYSKAKGPIPGVLGTEPEGQPPSHTPWAVFRAHPLLRAPPTNHQAALKGEGGISLPSEPSPHLPGAASSPIQHQSPRRALARGWQRLPHGHPELVGAHPCGNSTARGVWMRPQQQSVHPDPPAALAQLDMVPPPAWRGHRLPRARTGGSGRCHSPQRAPRAPLGRWEEHRQR